MLNGKSPLELETLNCVASSGIVNKMVVFFCVEGLFAGFKSYSG